MTDRHSQRTQNGPSMGSIVIGAVATSVVVTAMVYTTWAETIDSHHLVGTACALVLALALVGQTMGRIIERERVQRRRYRAESARLRAESESTGRWFGVHGEHLTVRWDEDSRRYLVHGRLATDWLLTDPTPWPDLDSLARLIVEMEGHGIEPADDIGTRSIRARLDVPGWEIMPERLGWSIVPDQR